MYACTLISFINVIRASSLYQEDNSPMVVHCSAGIGRTGAFIVIDSMLRMAEKEKKIDVFGHFCKVRMQRINMVEKFAQYRFVYQVLLEALSHDPTDIGCIDFAAYLERLTKGSDKTSLLYKQYEVGSLILAEWINNKQTVYRFSTQCHCASCPLKCASLAWSTISLIEGQTSYLVRDNEYSRLH